MTYACFLAVFLLPPLAGMGLLLRQHLFNRRYWSVTVRLLLLVLPAMTVWDHTATALGLWNWTPRQTWGVSIWLIPLEEYLFALLETVLLTMLMYAVVLWQRQGIRVLGRKWE